MSETSNAVRIPRQAARITAPLPNLSVLRTAIDPPPSDSSGARAGVTKQTVGAHPGQTVEDSVVGRAHRASEERGVTGLATSLEEVEGH